MTASLFVAPQVVRGDRGVWMWLLIAIVVSAVFVVLKSSFLKYVGSFLSVNKYYWMSDEELGCEASKWKIRSYGNSNGTIERQDIIDALLKKDNANHSRVAIWISLFSLLISFSGAYYSLVQIDEIRKEQQSRGFDYMEDFYRDLSTGKNSEILLAVEKNKPVLKVNGGRFTEDDLDVLLGKYDDLYTLRERGLIDDELLYNGFSDDFIRVLQNEEVGSYIQRIRQDGVDYFLGVDGLRTIMANYEANI